MQQQRTSERLMRGGFTLVELLLVMMMVILLTAAAIGGIIRSQRTFTFNGADQQVGSLVREARSLAVTGKAVIDYTDYDNDGDTTDRVTPAHYGIHFDAGSNLLTLFADMHGSGTEGVYDAPTGGFQVYTAGEDMKIAEYTVPATLDLLVEGSNGTTVDTVMFSPIFADTTFYDSAGMAAVDLLGGGGSATEFFMYGIRENSQTDPLERCMAVHPLSGVAETTAKTSTNCP